MARHLTSIEEYRRLVAGATSEDDLLADVAQRLTLGGWRWHHIRRTDLGLQMGDPGFPDLIATRRDQLLVVELKGPRGSYEPGQTDWLAGFVAVKRVHVATWRPSDLDTIVEVLR
jgi:hypothetical protein